MQKTISLSARRIKAARALLDWSQDDLAHAANLSIATIGKLESGHISRSPTTNSIQKAFEDNGIEFIEPDGVRFRPDDVVTYWGSDGVADFFDDIHRTVKKKGGDVIAVCTSESLLKLYAEQHANYAEKITAIRSKAPIKCLLTYEKPAQCTTSFCESRSLSKHHIDAAPFYAYGDKYAVFEMGPSLKIIVLHSPSISYAIRRQFYSMWNKANNI